MNDDETWQLQVFQERARNISVDPLVTSNTLGTTWSMEFERTKGMSITTTGPNEILFRNLLLELRRFTMQKEPVNLNRIHNVLWRELRDASLRDSLQETRDEWKAGQRGLISLVVNGTAYRADSIFDLWINGVYFHDERYKRETLQTFGPIVGALSVNVMHDLAIDAVRAVLRTNWIIENARGSSGFVL